MFTQICPNAVVIDTGSHYTKIGFAGDDEPQSIIRTATGTIPQSQRKNQSNKPSPKCNKYLIDESLYTHSQLENVEITKPYNCGTVENMEALSSIWMNTMQDKLQINENKLKETPILLTEPSFWSNSNVYSHLYAKYRENYCQTMFEDFDCPAMYLCKDAVLSSFSHGYKSSIVLDLGASSTRCTPIFDGYVINSGCKVTKCAAKLFDELLVEKMVSDLNINANYSFMRQDKNYKESYKKFMKDNIICDLRESVFKIRNTRPQFPNLTFPYKYNDKYTLNQLQNDGNKYAPPFKTNNPINSLRTPIKQEIGNNNNNDVDMIKTENNKIKLENNGNINPNEPRIKMEKEIPIKLENNNNNNNNNNNINNNKLSRSSSPNIKLEKDIIMDDKSGIFMNREYIYTLPDGQKLEGGEWQYSLPELMFIDYHQLFSTDLEDDWIEKMKAETESKSNIDDCDKYNDSYYYENTRQIWKDNDYKTFKFKGLSSMIVEALNECDIDIRGLCMKNVIICGGHSRYKGFIERIAKELTFVVPYSYKYKLHYNQTPRERLFSPWLGGSILSSTNSFQNMWITKEQYKEYGKSIVHRKCI